MAENRRPYNNDVATANGISQADNAAGRKRVNGKHICTFAVVADTHVQSPHDAPSPWKTNDLANARAKFAFSQMIASKPAFVVHLGDVTNPVPHLANFDSACEEAKAIIEESGLNTYIVAGNHDVGDKISGVIPNHPIDQFSIEKFEGHWGPSYRSFDVQQIHFIIINSSLIGSSLPQETEQMDWIEHDLATSRGKRMFVFSHYPLFMEDPTEPATYDNIECEGRIKLLGLLREYHVEAAIAGHVHNFFYNRYEDTELYGLLSTTFVRHDYSEMFHVPPADEFGRNDTPKLGWAEIEIYEQGHVLQTVRALDPMRTPSAELSRTLPINAASHPKHQSRSSLGVNLRSAWAEANTLMYRSPVDEFARRRARNDYLLLALWESGIHELRVPLGDLLRPEYTARMAHMVDIGHRFTVFHVGVPNGQYLTALVREQKFVSAFEIVLPWQNVEDQVDAISEFVEATQLPVYLACISSPIDHRQKPYRVTYFVSYGFNYDELDLVSSFHQRHGKKLGLGYTFRIGPDESPLTHGSIILRDFVHKHNIPVTFNISSASQWHSKRFDDVLVASRSAEATILSYLSFSPVFLDTLVDIDRGYTPANGLYDGLYNPKLAARAVASLQSICRAASSVTLLTKGIKQDDEDNGGITSEYTLGVDGRRLIVVLPRSATVTSEELVQRCNALRGSTGDSIEILTLARLEKVRTSGSAEAEPVVIVAE